jgi:hypothetical protein
MAARYRKFNMPALLDAAVKAAGDGAQHCELRFLCFRWLLNQKILMSNYIWDR